MLKACQYCGKVHAKNYDCGKKPARPSRYQRDSSEAGRYSYAFTEKSKEIKERSHYLCAVCLENGSITYDELETHHIIKLKERPDLLTEDSNLICLCSKHHKMADRGEIHADYLMMLAGKRDSDPAQAGVLPNPKSPKTTFPQK